jgi:hypothetical protein
MGRFDLGVFVDAHYLLGVRAHERNASVVLDRIAAAAEEQCMSFGIADRLVVADCSNPRARNIAEDFGRYGFVIRHVPEGALLNRANVLTAEIVEATAGREELRTVAVVADRGVPLSVADSLHRAGRALIGCVAGEAQDVQAVDHVIVLALDREGLRPLMHQAVASIRATHKEEVQVHEFAGILRALQPGFVASAYGVSLTKLVQQLAGPEYQFVEPDRIVLKPEAAAGTVRREIQNGTGAGTGNDAGSTPSLTKALQQAAQVLPPIPPTDEASVVKALRSVLDLASERQQLRDAAMKEGLTIQVVCAGLRVVADGYTSLGHKTLDLCRQAVAGSVWRVEQSEANPAQIRLRLTGGPSTGQT